MKATKKGINRLKTLAKYLKLVPAKHLAMGSWFHGPHDWVDSDLDDDSEFVNEFGQIIKEKISCGTTACAAGWACSIPSLNKQGLKLKIGGFDRNIAVPSYNGTSGFYALEQFFTMTGGQAWDIFSQDAYDGWSEPGPKKVAAKILRMVAKMEKRMENEATCT